MKIELEVQCVKCSRQVEENEEGWVGRGSSGTEGLSHCEVGCLSGVSSPET